MNVTHQHIYEKADSDGNLEGQVRFSLVGLYGMLHSIGYHSDSGGAGNLMVFLQRNNSATLIGSFAASAATYGFVIYPYVPITKDDYLYLKGANYTNGDDIQVSLVIAEAEAHPG